MFYVYGVDVVNIAITNDARGPFVFGNSERRLSYANTWKIDIVGCCRVNTCIIVLVDVVKGGAHFTIYYTM